MHNAKLRRTYLYPSLKISSTERAIFNGPLYLASEGMQKGRYPPFYPEWVKKAKGLPKSSIIARLFGKWWCLNFKGTITNFRKSTKA